MTYDPHTPAMLDFAAAREGFLEGRDTPRDFLERCIAVIESRDQELGAFVCTNLSGARKAADAANKRYADGTPLSLMDGLPVGVKDIYETADMPTQYGSDAYVGNETGRDAAWVWAMRRGGAAIVGKTTTPEFAFGDPKPCRNPHNPEHTAGGTSSGSAASVGAAMLPVAFGNQVKGSLLRPAGFCGAYAFKSTHGALNRGGDMPGTQTTNHLGPIAGTLEDAWRAALFVCREAGPNPGHAGIVGPETLPDAAKPQRLMRFDTPGWTETDDESRTAFEDYLARLAAAGVEIVTRKDDADLARFHELADAAEAVLSTVTGFEMRWPMEAIIAEKGDLIGPRATERALRGLDVSLEQYREGLEARLAFRAALAALQKSADALIALTSPGPAPKGVESTGNAACQVPSSLLGSPTMTLPHLIAGGLPLGIQLHGFVDGDAALAAIARWLDEAFQKGEI
jgi:Asp-tRNA(Asn)/Glu-tRNA(Gln) amidotransferase A subunit family amidase